MSGYESKRIGKGLTVVFGVVLVLGLVALLVIAGAVALVMFG